MICWLLVLINCMFIGVLSTKKRLVLLIFTTLFLVFSIGATMNIDKIEKTQTLRYTSMESIDGHELKVDVGIWTTEYGFKNKIWKYVVLSFPKDKSVVVVSDGKNQSEFILENEK